MSLDLQCKADGSKYDGLGNVCASSIRKGPATSAFRRLKVPANRVECVNVYRDSNVTPASESTTPITSSINVVPRSGFLSVIAVDDEPQLPDVAPEGNPTVQMDSCCSPRSRRTMESIPCSLDSIQSTPQSTAGENVSNCRSPSSRSTTIDYQSPRVVRGGSAVNAFRSPRGRITSPVSLKSSPASSKGTSTSEDIELLGAVSAVSTVASGSRRQFRFATKKTARRRRATTKAVVEAGTRALVIKKRWLDLILAGQKTWEIRGSTCHKRGLIRLAQSKLGGMIVGEVTVTDCLRVTLEDLQRHVDKHCITDLGLVEYKEIFAWVLSDARRFRQPQPYDHKAGAITWVELDADTIQHCNAASAECKGLIVDDDDDVIMESVESVARIP